MGGLYVNVWQRLVIGYKIESKRSEAGPVNSNVADLLETLKRSIERAQERKEQVG